MPRPTYAEVNLDHVAHNYAQLTRLAGAACTLIVPVKANAYGHGAVPVARVLEAGGARWLAVATVEEGVELRDAGVRAGILLLGYLPDEDHESVFEYGLTPSITETGQAARLSEDARRRGVRLGVHVNVDTGMHRLGLDWTHAAGALRCIAELSHLALAGVWTHFATSDGHDLEMAGEQLARLGGVCRDAGFAGAERPMRHVCNSAGFLRMPRARLEGARPGIALYGMLPENCGAFRPLFKPALTVRTRVAAVRHVSAGQGIGYGHTVRPGRDTVLATLPIGYHDGMLIQCSNRGEVLVGGRRVPVIGRVCMDQCMVDVTDVPRVEPGAEAVLYGRQGEEELSVEECAARAGTIPYNVTCSVGGRVPRRYVWRGVACGAGDVARAEPERMRSPA